MRLTMCRLRQSTSAVSWWRPTSVAFSTDWICSRLACTQEAERLQTHANKHAETHPHSHTRKRQTRTCTCFFNCDRTHAPANGNSLIRESIKADLRVVKAHKPWCWRGHVLLISVALPHHPASPPMLCDFLTASVITRRDRLARRECEGGFPPPKRHFLKASAYLLEWVNLAGAAPQIILQDVWKCHSAVFNMRWGQG